MSNLKFVRPAIDRFGLTVAIAMIAYQGVTALRYAWQVPAHDEWLAIAPGGFDGRLTERFVLGFLQEHIVVPTRLVAWLTYAWFDGAPIVQVCFNYALFVGAVALFYRLVRRLELPGAALLLGALALPMQVDVHAWGFQTHFYASLFVFFALLNVLGWQGKKLRLAVPLVVLSVFSFGSGIVFAAVAAAVCAMLMFWHPERRWVYGAVIASAFAAVLRYLQLLNHVHLHVTASKNFFPKPLLVPYFVRLLAKPFGWQEHGPAIAGSVIALALFASVMALGYMALRKRSVDQMIFVGAVAGVLGVSIVIAIGRSPYGVVFANDTRNTTYTLFLVPMLWCMQVALNSRRPLWLAALAVVLIAPLVPKADYQTPYRAFYERGVVGKRCLWDYYLGANDGCKDLMPWFDSKPYFDWAWKLDLAFVREFKQMNPGAPTRYDKEASPAGPRASLEATGPALAQ